MTIGLTHNTDLWRVQIALSGLNSAVSSVLVERSANEILWSTARGGTTLPIVSGAGSLDDYEYFASADGSLTTFYRVTTVDPAPGLLLTGTSGDYASTPDDASLDITGDLDLRVEVFTDDWTPDASSGLVAKFNSSGDQRSYMFRLNIDGTLGLFWSTDGTAGGQESESSSTAVPSTSKRQALRATLDVDNGSSEHVVTFYTAPGIGGPWTQLGDPVTTAGTTSIHAGTEPMEAGSYHGGTTGVGDLTIIAVEVRDGIDGTVVANPDFSVEESGTSSFDDVAGLTWTINGDAEIVTFETNSIAVTQTDIVLKSIRYPLLNRSVRLGDYSDLERPAQLGVHAITGRSFPVATTDVNSSVRFQMELVTETPDEARRIKLLLALGDILYLQSPAEVNPRRPPRSMYVVADSSAVGRIGSHDWRRHTVPFTEVAAPSAQVTGGTLTWGTVFRTFGSWQQLISANPSWSDLLATVGDPDDLVTF